jgi:carbonic anhydrase
VPPYERDEKHHGTSAALEFAVCYLNVKRIIILGHSQCGGIKSLVNQEEALSGQDDFISNWVSVVKTSGCEEYANNPDDYAKIALQQSYQNSLTFPWITEKVAAKELAIHRWFFDIKLGQIFTYCEEHKAYNPLA